MRKIIAIILILVVITTFKDLSLSENIIPNEAIRLRILANSNSWYDQYIKGEVKEKVQSDMSSLLASVNNVDQARSIINTSLSTINSNVGKVLKKENYDLGYTVDFGIHSFPQKEYKGITYKAGDYESLLVTLGKGKGDNWWCVLFPPLCLLEAEESTEVEYKFFVQELIDKFF